jgi:tRNA (mo5U34)-methyltransferase
MTDAGRAEQLIADDRIVWYQRYEIAPGVVTPGVVDTLDLMRRARFPEDMTGMSVLDIGTSNGALAFEAERRGASHVVATDIYPPTHFGFAATAELLGSRVTFLRASVYELPSVLRERFDVVAFFGVLYHLRHPLLGLDATRRLSTGSVFIESAVADDSLPADQRASGGLVRFFRKAELGDDSSNWFVPTVATLVDWCASAGLGVQHVDGWPDPTRPARCAIHGTVVEGPPEYEQLSYEVPLDVRVDLTPVVDRRH